MSWLILKITVECGTETMIKKTKLLLFQEDLRNGMTIEDALQKHGMSFQYAVENMPRPLTKKQNRPKHYRKKKHGGHTQ